MKFNSSFVQLCLAFIVTLLDSPPTLPDLIQKLKLIQFSFERSLRQDLTQFIALGKVLEQLKIALAQHSDKPLNLVSLLIPVCNLANISVAQFFLEDISTLGKILSINFNNQFQKTIHTSSLASMFNKIRKESRAAGESQRREELRAGLSNT